MAFGKFETLAGDGFGDHFMPPQPRPLDSRGLQSTEFFEGL